MVFIYILVSLILTLISVYVFKRKINPFSIYSCLWIVVVLLYGSRLIQYDPILVETWGILFVALFSYFFGCMLAKKIRLKRIKVSKDGLKNPRVRRVLNTFIIDRKTIELMIFYLSIIAFVFLAIPLSKLISVYGINIISSIGKIYNDNIKGESQVSTSFLVNINYIAIALTGIYWAKYKFKFILLIPIVNAFIMQLISGSRGTLVISLVMLLGPILIYGFKNKKSKRLFIGLMAVSALFLLLVTLFRTSSDAKIEYASPFLSFLCRRTRLPYSGVEYLTSPLAGFNAFLEKPFEWEFGKSTFRLIYKYFSSVDVERIDEFIYKTPIVTNVYTYLGNLYADFGFIGICIFTPLLGFLFTLCYRKMYHDRSLAYAVLFDALFVIIVLSFFSWYVAYMNVMIVVLFGIGGLILKKLHVVSFSRVKKRKRYKKIDTSSVVILN